MKILSATNPRYTASGLIDLTVTFDTIGTVEFTASPDDSEPHGVELFEWANAGEFGPVAEYVAPQVTPDQIKAKAEALSYLASTDWYVVRKAETGEAIPAAIAKARQEAREAVNNTEITG